MISLADKNRERDFAEACEFDEIIGARMVTLSACYGFDCDFCRLWLQTDESGRPTAAISRFEGWLVISAEKNADLDELSAFVKAVGGYRYIEAAPFVCKSLGVNGEYDESHMMRYTSNRAFRENYDAIIKEPPLKEVYGVVTVANPWVKETTDWSGWYVHTSHLVRHKLGFAALLCENGRPVSTGGVFTASRNLSVISCIATLPEFRGKGYAALITKYLADKSISQKKQPALFCASDKLADYYRTLGFSCEGKWGQITLKE